MRSDGEGDYRVEPEDPGECPHHGGHDARVCELCDWEPIEVALDEALEAFDALEPRELQRSLPLQCVTRATLHEHDPWAPPSRALSPHRENDLPIAAE